MSIPAIVEQFYERIWNAGDLDAISRLLTGDFAFRSSLGRREPPTLTPPKREPLDCDDGFLDLRTFLLQFRDHLQEVREA